MYTDENAFKNRVKEFNKLSRGKGPAKGPGYYSSDQIVTGRDGKQWKNLSVFFEDNNGEERWVLVWVLA